MKAHAQTPDAFQRRLRRRALGRYRYVRLRWRVLFAVVDCLGGLLFHTARRLSSLWRSGHGSRGWGGSCTAAPDPNVILLVQLDHLGDAIITTAMLPLLRQRYAHARIEVLASPSNREVFEACAEIDGVHVCRVNRFARAGWTRGAWVVSMLWWGLRLRRRRVDLAIDVRGDFPSAVIVWLCGARRRVGWSCGGGGFLLTDSPEFVAGRPEVESRLALLAVLGIYPPEPVEQWRPIIRPLPFCLLPSAFCLLPSAAVRAGQARPPRIVLQVGAGTTAKQWPAEHWRELLGRLIVAHAAEVVLVGSDRERIIARQVLQGRQWPGVVDRTGQLTLMELAALLQQADLLVGCDSGPAHLAAAVGTPVVVLFSGTNDARQWQPRGRAVTVVRHEVQCSPCHREHCPLADHPCMRGLRPQWVARAAATALAAAGPTHGECGRAGQSIAVDDRGIRP